MIRVTQLGGGPFIVNADLIQYVESRPETFITLTTGDRIVVVETMDEVVARAVRYQQTKHMIPAPGRPTAEAPSGRSDATSSEEL